MLGRKDYTQAEYDDARGAVAQQLATYKKVAKLVGADAKTLNAFEAVYFNNMALALDRRFVHRVRAVTGKDGTPLNELELIAESLMNNGGVFAGNTVIKYVREASVVKLGVGDPITLSAADFQRLAAACFDELHRKFL